VAPLSDQRFEGFASQLLYDELAKDRDGKGCRFSDVDGIVLFVDIVDSTSMTDAVAATGPDGAERLGDMLNDYFRYVMNVVSRHGGDVMSIDGDAVIALWRVDGSISAQAMSAARAAIALREIDHCWPVRPPAPLRHRLTLAAGKFTSVILSGTGHRRFHVLAGEPLRTIGAILHRGEPGEVIVDGVMAQMLGEAASLEPIDTPVKASHGAVRLDRLVGAESKNPISARRSSPIQWSTPECFLPRVVVVRSQSGLAAWMMEFRIVTLVYARLGASDVADAVAGAQLQRMFAVVAQAAEAFDVEIFRVVADEKGVIALIVCGLPPFSSESNAACAAGIAERIRQEASRLGISHSLGVATGRVFCGLIGNATRREYMLNGPVMNYGARLMQAADDDVLYDAETARAASGRFAFSAAEEILVKGRGHPFAVHRLSQAFAAPVPLPAGHKALVGRDAEYAELTERLGSGDGGLVVLEGEPGAGKSRLLQALREAADRRRHATIEAATHVIERATPYYVFRAFVQQLLRERGDREPVSPSLLRTRLHEALAGTDLIERTALIEDVMPLGLPSTDLAAQIKGAARQAGIEDIVVALAARRMSDQALLILLDDLHWIDALSADLLLAVARRLPQLLIVVTSRPLDVTEAPHGGRVVQRASRCIPVTRIDTKGTAQIIADLVMTESVPRRLVDFVYRQSEGLPMHIEQLVLSLEENGLIEARDGKCLVHASDLRTAAVPQKLRDLVVGRIDHLGQTDQLVAKVASVIGRVFEMDTLRAIYPLPTEALSLEASVRRLTLSGILEPASGGDSAAHAFRHVIIQEVTYDLLSYAQRRSIHLRLVEQIERQRAEMLEPHYSELAHHCEHAGEMSRAIQFRLSAASLAVLRSANDDALMHLERADRLARGGRIALTDAQRSTFAFLRGEALHALARFSDAEGHFKECMRLNGIKRPKTPLQIRLSTFRQLGRQAAHRLGLMRVPHDEAMRERERLSALLHTRLAERAYFMCQSAELEHDTLAALNQAEKVGAVSETIGGYGALAIGLGTTRLYALGRYYRQRAVDESERVGELRDRGFARLYGGVYSMHTCDWHEARTLLQEGAKVFERLGDRFRRQSCRAVLGFIAMATADYRESRAILSELGPDGEGAETNAVRVWVLAGLSALDMLEGRPPAAAVRRMDSARESVSYPAERHLCDGVAAAARLRAGDVEGAQRIADQALQNLLAGFCTMGSAWNSATAIAAVFLELLERSQANGAGDEALHARAAEACRAVSAYAARTRICRPRALVLEGRIALAEGRKSRASGQFQRALDWARRLRMPLEEALSHLGLARALTDGEARGRHFEQGRSMLHAIGAQPWGYDSMAAAAVASKAETAFVA
jgi:class 3 adenylate cyclase/tetratricopeptide (TPR) repeat protein